MALLLTGCASHSARFSAGDGNLTVSLPSACEPFLAPVPVPKVTRQTDARLAYTRTADALDDANDRLTAGGLCVADQRRAYAGTPTQEKRK